MRLLIDESIELNTLDEKRFEKTLADLKWLGKHAPDLPLEKDKPSTAVKAREAARLIGEVLGEIGVVK